MITNRYNLWDASEYHYPMAFEFVPNIKSYLHDEDQENRPCIIIAPGGGYEVVSPPEGEVVAREFYARGYNTFVCTYTTNYLNNAPLQKQPMYDLARAIRYVRKNAQQFHVLENQIILCGFSAGAHLCGSVCVHFDDCPEENPAYQNISARPDGSILSYPVITSGEYAHRGSFDTLLGKDASPEALEYMSLEKQVTRDTPPCFLWQTVNDETVPVMNSYLYAMALLEHNIPYAHHVFSKGHHGISLANQDWFDAKWNDPYCMEQVLILANKVLSGEITDGTKSREEIIDRFSDPGKIAKMQVGIAHVNPEVMVWPELCDQWLHKIFCL